jgi:hypothetical protein
MLRSRITDTFLFLPGQSQQNTLSHIYNGSKNELFIISDEMLADFDLCRCDLQHLLKEEAQAYYDSLVKLYEDDDDYITVQGPMRFSKEEYLVEAELTPDGITALKALSAGYVWDHNAKAMSIDETLVFYKRQLQRATVQRKDIDTVVRMAKSDPRLKELSNLATYVMMRGNSDGGTIVIGTVHV